MEKFISKFEGRLVTEALDVGTGTGASLELLTKFSTHVVGIDVMPELLTWADHRIRKKRVSYDLREMDIMNPEFPPNKFNIILSNGFGGFIDNTELERLYGILHFLLKDGGRFYQYFRPTQAAEVYSTSPRAELAGAVARIINYSTFSPAILASPNQRFSIDPTDFGFEGGYYDIRGKSGARFERFVKIPYK